MSIGSCLAAATNAAEPKDPAAEARPADKGAVADEPKLPVRNGYGELLSPSVKRTSYRPYAPIQKDDDQASIPEIEMFVGESRVFPTPKVARIAVGNGQIMNAAALDSKEVIVFANGIGTSSLFIWTQDGRYQRVKVNIVAGDTTRHSREIAAFLAAIPNAKASVIGDNVIVEGEELSDLDIAKIEALGKRYPQIVNFTNRLGWEQMVIMDVKVVEFPINELREIGLKWGAAGGASTGALWSPIRRGDNANYQVNLPSDASPPITPANGGNVLVLPSGLHVMSVLNLGLNAQLNLLAQNGSASILAEPQLSARNGAKASFLAGGEYPYTVSSSNGPTVLFKPYGIKLDIQPKVDRNGIVRATIESEVSAIDTSVSTLAGPAISSRKTNTEFNVRSGETLVLSGLLSRKTSTSIDKLPLLGDLPVIGALFRSKRFQNDETELVVFVTPTVVDSRSPGLVDRIDKTVGRLERELGRPPFLTAPLQPERGAERFNDPASNGDLTRPDETPSRPPPPSLQPEGRSPQEGASLLQPESSRLAGAPLVVIDDDVVLRAAPSVTARPLVPLPRGAMVRLTAAEPQSTGAASWRQVRAGEIEGWIVADAAQPRGRQTPSTAGSPVIDPAVDPVMQPAANSASITANRVATPPVTPLERVRVAARSLALRVAPDVNAAIVVRLNEGDVVEALPQAPRGYWMAVQHDGKRGWLPSQWLAPAL